MFSLEIEATEAGMGSGRLTNAEAVLTNFGKRIALPNKNEERIM